MSQDTATVVDLYARISVDKRGQAESVEDQISALRAYCERQGWRVGHVYRDDGISAYKGKRRPGFNALLKREVKRPVVAVHLDRLARLSEGIEALIAGEFPIYTINSSGFDLTTPGGRAYARTMVAWATAEIETKSQRQRDRAAADAAKGLPYWRRRPFGYELDGTTREAEAQAIRDGAAAVLAGSTTAAVARDWNARGLTTPQAKNTGGLPWDTRSVARTLLSERNAALRVYGGTTTPGAWTAILTEAEHQQVVAVLSDPARNSGGGRLSNWLSGIALCGTCGATMFKGKAGRKEHRRRAYVCSARGHNARTADEVERFVLMLLLQQVTSPLTRAVLLEDTDAPDLPALRAEAATLRARLAEWETAAAAGEVGPGEFTRITASIRAQIADVEARMSHRDRAVLFADLIGFEWSNAADRERAIATFEGLDVGRKQELVQAVFDSITLAPGDRRREFDPRSIEVVIRGRKVEWFDV